MSTAGCISSLLLQSPYTKTSLTFLFHFSAENWFLLAPSSTFYIFFFLQCSLISTFRLSSLTQYPVTCIFFSSLDYRTVICLRLVVGNDLAENFPWEPLDGRCLHKSSWEIIVTCCLAPMLEEQRCPWKFSHPPVFTFIRSLTRSFIFFNFILSCQLYRLWPTRQWNELNTDV